jgi:hypothetical protein
MIFHAIQVTRNDLKFQDAVEFAGSKNNNFIPLIQEIPYPPYRNRYAVWRVIEEASLPESGDVKAFNITESKVRAIERCIVLKLFTRVKQL